MRALDILQKKGFTVHAVSPGAPLSAALALMARHSIGAVPVLNAGGWPVALLGERDILRAVARDGRSVLDKPVETLGATHVATCAPDTALHDIMVLMTFGRLRHVLVVQEASVIGILSIGDLVKHRLRELETETMVLRDALTFAHVSALA